MPSQKLNAVWTGNTNFSIGEANRIKLDYSGMP